MTFTCVWADGGGGGGATGFGGGGLTTVGEPYALDCAEGLAYVGCANVPTGDGENDGTDGTGRVGSGADSGINISEAAARCGATSQPVGLAGRGGGGGGGGADGGGGGGVF